MLADLEADSLPQPALHTALERYRGRRQVASPARVAQLLQKATPLAALLLELKPVSLARGGAGQGPSRAAGIAERHILSGPHLLVACSQIWPEELRRELQAACKAAIGPTEAAGPPPPTALRTVFEAALALHKEESCVGALLGPADVSTAAALKRTVMNRLGVVRLLVLMFRVLMRGGPAAASTAAVAATAAAAAAVTPPPVGSVSAEVPSAAAPPAPAAELPAATDAQHSQQQAPHSLAAAAATGGACDAQPLPQHAPAGSMQQPAALVDLLPRPSEDDDSE